MENVNLMDHREKVFFAGCLKSLLLSDGKIEESEIDDLNDPLSKIALDRDRSPKVRIAALYSLFALDKPLLVENRRGGERHVVVSRGGKPARTRVSLSRTFGKFSLMNCLPETGRTHQLRVHLASMDFPILCDERYGNEEQNRLAKKHGLKRLFLHAQSISFPDDSGNELHFTAPLSNDLQHFLDVGVRRIQGKR